MSQVTASTGDPNSIPSQWRHRSTVPRCRLEGPTADTTTSFHAHLQALRERFDSEIQTSLRHVDTAVVQRSNRLRAIVARQTQRYLDAVFARPFVSFRDIWRTLSGSRVVRPHDAADAVLRLNVALWTVCRDLELGRLRPVDLPPRGHDWSQVGAEHILEVAKERIRADAIDWKLEARAMLQDPLWQEEPVEFEAPGQGVVPLGPDTIRKFPRSLESRLHPSQAAIELVEMPLLDAMLKAAVSVADQETPADPIQQSRLSLSTAFAMFQHDGSISHMAGTVVALAEATGTPIFHAELARGDAVKQLKGTQGEGEILGLEWLDEELCVVLRLKGIGALCQEIRTQMDAGELAHLTDDPEAAHQLETILSGPDGVAGGELQAKMEALSKSCKNWRRARNIAIVLASVLVGAAAGETALKAGGSRAVSLVSGVAGNALAFSSLSNLAEQRWNLSRYPKDLAVMAVLSMAGVFARGAAGLLTSSKSLNGALARWATPHALSVAAADGVWVGLEAMERALSGEERMTFGQAWQRFLDNLGEVVTLHLSTQALLVPRLARSAWGVPRSGVVRSGVPSQRKPSQGGASQLGKLKVDVGRSLSDLTTMCKEAARLSRLPKGHPERQRLGELTVSFREVLDRFSRQSGELAGLRNSEGLSLRRDLLARVEKLRTQHAAESGTPRVARGELEITPELMPEYLEQVGGQTIEILSIPGSEVPPGIHRLLPRGVNQVGHLALRVGGKVYHLRGNSTYVVEPLDTTCTKTYPKYRIFGEVFAADSKTQTALVEALERQIEGGGHFNFLTNNCTEFVCHALEKAGVAPRISPLIKLDPALASRFAMRHLRPVARTIYNTGKGPSRARLAANTLKNRGYLWGLAGSTAIVTAAAAQAVALRLADLDGRLQDRRPLASYHDPDRLAKDLLGAADQLLHEMARRGLLRAFLQERAGTRDTDELVERTGIPAQLLADPTALEDHLLSSAREEMVQLIAATLTRASAAPKRSRDLRLSDLGSTLIESLER